jgi:hypothetical protein
MKVFIAYGGAADQVTALRLQALGAVNGLTVYNFGTNLVVIDPAKPDEAEIGIVRHLKTIDAQQNAKKALLALGTLALGLLIFAPAD